MIKNHFSPDEVLNLLTPIDMGLVYTSVQRIEPAHQILSNKFEEMCCFIIKGTVSYSCGTQEGIAEYKDMLYLPCGMDLELNCKDGENAVIMRFGAPCSIKTEFAHIKFTDVDADQRHNVYGEVHNGTRRDVWNYIDESFNSGRFLTGICRGAQGGWTAWPPHKHGEKREEVYVYFGMDDGFALQCVYEDFDSPDAVKIVKDGHLIAIPEGYHPNVGCPKTGIQYIYCMVSTTEGDRNFMDLTMQSCYGDKL